MAKRRANVLLPEPELPKTRILIVKVRFHFRFVLTFVGESDIPKFRGGPQPGCYNGAGRRHEASGGTPAAVAMAKEKAATQGQNLVSLGLSPFCFSAR